MNKLLIYIGIIILFPFIGINAQTVVGPTLNRKALVAPNCVIDKIVSVVGAGTGATNLNNLLDADLTNSTTFINIVGAGVTMNPVVSVKDLKYTYAANTTAGFSIVAGSGSNLLSLDVIKAVTILVYDKGVLKQTLTNTEGQNVQTLGLNLIQLPGSGEAMIHMTVKPTVQFDEICLALAGGVNVGVGTTLSVKYAFVGDVVQTNLITSALSATGNTISASGLVTTVAAPSQILPAELNKLLNDNLSDGATVTPVAALGFQYSMKLTTNKVFKSGSEVGFKYKDANVLSLSVGSYAVIRLYNLSNTVVQTDTISSSVLGLGAGSGGAGAISIHSNVNFSSAEFAMYTVVSVGVSARTVHYGFVREQPDVTQLCDLRLSMNNSICSGQSYYQLLSNPSVPVTWSLVSAPSVNVTVSSSGAVQNMDVVGDYKFKATAASGCTDTVTITKGIAYTGEGSDPLGCSTNILSQPTTGAYFNYDAMKVTSLVSAGSTIANLGNMIDNDKTTATTIQGVKVAAGIVIAVKTGRTLDQSDQLTILIDKNAYLAGVAAGSWLKVDTYYRGVKTSDSFSNWNLLGANSIGLDDKTLLLMSPTMPYDEVRMTFGQIASVLAGVNIYGLFIRHDVDGDGLPDCHDNDSCHDFQNIQIAPVCVGQTITITGKAFRDTPYTLNMPDQSRTIPFRTNAVDGSFSITVTNVLNAGRFTFTFTDGSGSTAGSAPYRVHPLLTQWLANAVDTDWNNWNNWSAGAPYCCTNVIIPSNATLYPILNNTTGVATENCCNYIHFEPNSEVVKTNKLTYTKAWVEYLLAPNRYYMLSAPLKNMYTGDFFVPAAMNGVQNNAYFVTLDKTNSPENRLNPRIYQRLWSTSAPGRLRDGTSTTITVSETRWSRHFNALKYNYPKANGFSLWVDNGKLSAATLFKFRFPKDHTEYSYYDELGNLTNVSETNLDRSQSGRFVYENADHTSTLPLSVVLTNEGAASTYFLVGNPFMSHIDVAKFLQQNQDVISALKVYDGNTNNTVIDVNGQLISNGPGYTQIAPMQSFFVVAKTAASSLAVTFTEDMLVAGPSSLLKRAIESNTLRITAEAAGQEASTVMLTTGINEPDSGVETLLDNQVKPSIALFSLRDNKAFDILSIHGDGDIPLGMYISGSAPVTLRFAMEDGSRTDEYVLKDRKTGIEYPMDSEISLGDMNTSLGRFSLHTRSAVTGTEKQESNDVFVELVGGQAVVRSLGKEIRSIDTFSLNGQKQYAVQYNNVYEASMPITPGMNILKITFSDQTTRSVKLLNL